jgi:hypothetical protein
MRPAHLLTQKVSGNLKLLLFLLRASLLSMVLLWFCSLVPFGNETEAFSQIHGNLISGKTFWSADISCMLAHT